MQVLVLGATGFIGGNIARAALAAGWPVRALRRDPDSIGDLKGLPVEWVNGDLNDPPSLLQSMQGCEVIFHAAAYYPHSRDNLTVAEHVTRALTQIEGVLDAFGKSGAVRLVYTSTLTTIGHPPAAEPRLADERDYYQPGDLAKSGYYECKIAMEARVEEASRSGLNVVILNPTAVFGPGDVHLSLGSMLVALADGQAFFWLPGDINVVDVRDMAKAHIQAAMKGKPGERYIIGGHNYSLHQALEVAASAAGVRPPWMKLPLWVIDILVALGDTLPSLPLPANHMRAIRHWQGYNTAKARAELGLSPRPFEQTVRDAIAWFQANGYL